MKKRIENEEIIVLKTDKSGKLAVMEKETYRKLGQEKCSKDKKITREEHRAIERRLNDQTKFWCRMLGSGSNHEHQDRVMKSK